MNLHMGIIIALAILLCVVFIYLLVLKGQLKHITRELVSNRNQDYNKSVTVQLFDKDLTGLAEELNHNLEYQKQLKREQRQQEQRTKQSISDIAHDLRTPLTVVKGNLQMLDKSGNLGEREQAYVQLCQQKADELKGMVDAFFELSVLESDSVPVQLTRVNITNLLIQFLVDNEILIKEKELTPEINIPEKTLYIHAEEQMVYRILSNLLGNVIKYARESFCVTLREEGEFCVLVFSNPVLEGHRIEPEHLFERSYMGDSSRHRKGNGLGLYIVKLLAEKQGAKAFAEIQNQELMIKLSFKGILEPLEII